jgi:succinyl-CoA synthetase alpha subunit
MSIFVDKNTKVVVVGLTGKAGSFHAAQCKAYGTKIVAGVTPGKGGIIHDGIPVFNTVHEAVAATGADCSLIFVPPPGAADAIVGSADAGIPSSWPSPRASRSWTWCGRERKWTAADPCCWAPTAPAS